MLAFAESFGKFLGAEATREAHPFEDSGCFCGLIAKGSDSAEVGVGSKFEHLGGNVEVTAGYVLDVGHEALLIVGCDRAMDDLLGLMRTRLALLEATDLLNGDGFKFSHVAILKQEKGEVK